MKQIKFKDLSIGLKIPIVMIWIIISMVAINTLSMLFIG